MRRAHKLLMSFAAVLSLFVLALSFGAKNGSTCNMEQGWTPSPDFAQAMEQYRMLVGSYDGNDVVYNQAVYDEIVSKGTSVIARMESGQEINFFAANALISSLSSWVWRQARLTDDHEKLSMAQKLDEELLHLTMECMGNTHIYNEIPLQRLVRLHEWQLELQKAIEYQKRLVGLIAANKETAGAEYLERQQQKLRDLEIGLERQRAPYYQQFLRYAEPKD